MPRFGDFFPRGHKPRELGKARRKGEMGPVGVGEEEGGNCKEQNPENEQEPVPDENGTSPERKKKMKFEKAGGPRRDRSNSTSRRTTSQGGRL
jgi:hypothetical protein